MSIPIDPKVIKQYDSVKHRIVILSGSRAQLRSLWVDEELDTETLNTSYSASVGGNLLVGENESIGGYLEITGSNVDGYVNWPNVGLLVSHGEVIGEDLHVVRDTSISGSLDVAGDTHLRGDLELDGNLRVHGSSSFDKEVEMSSSLFVSGNTVMSGTLVVDKEATFHDDVDIKKNLTVSESLAVSGSATVTGSLDVKEDTWIGGDTQIDGELSVGGNITGSSDLRILGDADIEGDFTVSGSSIFKNQVTIEENGLLVQEGGITVQSGDLDVQDGDTTLNGDLTVTGNTNLGGELEVSQDVLFDEDLRVKGFTDLEKDLHVTGSTSIHKDLAVTGSTDIQKDLHVTGSTSIHQNLAVTGSADIQQDLHVTGSTRINKNLNVDDDVFLGKNLRVTGSTDIQKDLHVTGSTILSGTLNVDDNVFLGKNLRVTGSTDIQKDLHVTGSAIVNKDVTVHGTFSQTDPDASNTFAGDLVVEGNLQVKGTTTYLDTDNVYIKDKVIEFASGSENRSQADGAGWVIMAGGGEEGSDTEDIFLTWSNDDNKFHTNAGFDFGDNDIITNGDVIANNGHFSGSMNVGGDATIQGTVDIVEGDLIIESGDADIKEGDLHVGGDVNIDQNLTVTGSADIKEDLHVEGSTTIDENLTVEGNLEVKKDTTLDGNLTVDGTSTFTDDVTITEGDLTINEGDVDVKEGDLVVEKGDTDIKEGDLHVGGNTTIDEDLLVKGNATVQKELEVDGDVTFNSDLHVDGVTDTGELEVVGDATIGENLLVGGDSTLEGDVTIGTDENHSDLHVTGNTQIDENLRVEGSASIGKSLEVESSASIGKSLEVAESGSFGGDFTVGGTSSFGDSIYVEGNITGSGDISASGDLYGDNGYFETDVEIGGDLEVSGNITAEGNISGSFIYGDGRYLINCSASIVSSSTYRLNLDLAGCTDCQCPERVIHPFRTMDVFVDVYEWDDEPGGTATRVHPTIRVVNDQEVQICSDRELHGYAIVADAGHLIQGNIQWQEDTRYAVEFENLDGDKTYRFNHGLGTEEIVVEVWSKMTVNPDQGEQYVQIIPEYIAIEDPNCINVLFGADIKKGRIVVTRVGGLVKQIEDVTEASTVTDTVSSAVAGSSVDVLHGFDTENVLVEVFKRDGNSTYLYSASKVEILDKDTVRVHFSEEFSGYVVVGKSGHVVNGVVDVHGNDIHYGTNGNWRAESFTADYLQGTKVKAKEGVDTSRVGDWTVKNEYGDENIGYGSYIDFSDEQGIEFYAAKRNTASPKVAQLTDGGDLYLKGGLYPSEVFVTSDINKKTDLVALNPNYILDEIQNFQGYRFRYRDSGERSIGVIAQEVQKMYPELVTEVPDLGPGSSKLVVNYGGLVAVLLEAIKGLSRRVSELERQRR